MTANNRRFAAFILSHGRADRVYTYQTLRKCGYTGEIYIICDNEDSQLPRYIELYGNQVIVFNKQEAIDNTDSGDNLKKRNSVVYARNQSFIIAKELGLTHFIQLDDDYSSFRYIIDDKNRFIEGGRKISSLDQIISAVFDFLDESGAYAVAFAQDGDFIGGRNDKFRKAVEGKFLRKVMNSFFFRVDRPVKFMGRINEDVNMYIEWGRRGYLFITILSLILKQQQTQSNSGGLTDIYLELGTYVKSFYTVMYAPSCVQIVDMGIDRRIHHRISWKYAVPLIMDEKYRKIGSQK